MFWKRIKQITAKHAKKLLEEKVPTVVTGTTIVLFTENKKVVCEIHIVTFMKILGPITTFSEMLKLKGMVDVMEKAVVTAEEENLKRKASERSVPLDSKNATS